MQPRFGISERYKVRSVRACLCVCVYVRKRTVRNERDPRSTGSIFRLQSDVYRLLSDRCRSRLLKHKLSRFDTRSKLDRERPAEKQREREAALLHATPDRWKITRAAATLAGRFRYVESSAGRDEDTLAALILFDAIPWRNHRGTSPEQDLPL